ncbi:hypothetical protein HPP92_026049 [Vanilla planifolia]|uniref:Cupin type-1 domain-containing protein n=1 Tax=Vanilla planifolia TaxID=51239 RepID=A0A835PEF8_VANPL|nr:hypothetical protein HPP92_026049 [Vanilla planifolia]
MAAYRATLLFLILFAAAAPSLAADPDLLQDICVADRNSSIKVNGFVCKPAAEVTSGDFFFNGLATAKATNNTLGSVVTTANVEQIPGLNTLGVSLSRIDYAPGGLNPPHTHPRATEIIFVLYGTLDVGFITTANKLISQTINQGRSSSSHAASSISRRTMVTNPPPSSRDLIASCPAHRPSPPPSLPPRRRCPTMSSPRHSRSVPRRSTRLRAALLPRAK